MRVIPDDIFVPVEDESTLTVHGLKERFSWLILGFSTRKGGVSSPPFDSFNCALHVGDRKEDVLANRRRLADRWGFSLKEMVCPEQIHKDALYKVKGEDKGRGSLREEDAIPATDGIYTDRPGIFLTSFYADCVPLYVIDAKNKGVGLAHAGWRGTVLEIGPKLVRRFRREFESSLDDILVVVGPAIGPCCYEVDDRVVDALSSLLPDGEKEKCIIPKEYGKYRIDLKKINAVLMEKEGIPPSNIFMSKLCTACHPDLFYSYRRDKGKTGRMASFIAIKE